MTLTIFRLTMGFRFEEIMRKHKVETTRLMLGMERYRPVHKSGVFDAIKGFCKGKKPKRRKVKG